MAQHKTPVHVDGVNVKRSAVKKGGTWAGIGSTLVGIAQTLPPGNAQLYTTLAGAIIAGIGGPLGSYFDARKANTAQGTR